MCRRIVPKSRVSAVKQISCRTSFTANNRHIQNYRNRVNEFDAIQFTPYNSHENFEVENYWFPDYGPRIVSDNAMLLVANFFCRRKSQPQLLQVSTKLSQNFVDITTFCR